MKIGQIKVQNKILVQWLKSVTQKLNLSFVYLSLFQDSSILAILSCLRTHCEAMEEEILYFLRFVFHWTSLSRWCVYENKFLNLKAKIIIIFYCEVYVSVPKRKIWWDNKMTFPFFFLRQASMFSRPVSPFDILSARREGQIT